jgi:hypothetical protein
LKLYLLLYNLDELLLMKELTEDILGGAVEILYSLKVDEKDFLR